MIENVSQCSEYVSALHSFQVLRNIGIDRNKSIDLLCKWIDWFLYDRDLRHGRITPVLRREDKRLCMFAFSNYTKTNRVNLTPRFFCILQGAST